MTATVLGMALFGAVLYRIRGGGFIHLPGTQAARFAWCLPTGALCGYLSGDPAIGALCAAAAFAGLMIPHGWAQNDDLLGLFGMSLVSAARAVLLCVPAWLVAGDFWYPTVVLACASGTAYQIGYRLPRLGDGSGLDGGTEWGEFLTGGLLWAGLTISS